MNIKQGLRPLPKDKLDFIYSQKFGAIPPPDFPFMVGEPLNLEKQGPDDTCGAHMVCRARGLQEKTELSPAYQFMLIKELEGDPNSWGSDLRTIAKSALKGSLETNESPFTIRDKGRDFIVNPQNWEQTPMGIRFELDMRAKKHKAQSYFFLNSRGYQDIFDACRSAMYQHRAYNRAIGAGLMWCPEWDNKEIVKEYGTPIVAHAILLAGQDIIEKQPYIVVQNSDNRLIKFSREVINQGLKYGAVMWIDENADQMKKELWTRLQWIRYFLRRYIGEILK